jgi:hypothetical protein
MYGQNAAIDVYLADIEPDSLAEQMRAKVTAIGSVISSGKHTLHVLLTESTTEDARKVVQITFNSIGATPK